MAKINKILEEATFYEHLYLKQEHYWLYNKIKPNTTFLDIGAWRGDTVLYFAMNPNIKKLIAYEPITKLCSVIKASLAENPLKNKVTIINKEISQASKIHNFMYSLDSNLVKSITLSQALSGLKNVAIKCDIEGMEKYIFKDADLSNVYALEVEYHSFMSSGVRTQIPIPDCRDEVVKALKAKGFKTSLIAHSGKSLEDDEDLKVKGYINAWKR